MQQMQQQQLGGQLPEGDNWIEEQDGDMDEEEFENLQQALLQQMNEQNVGLAGQDHYVIDDDADEPRQDVGVLQQFMNAFMPGQQQMQQQMQQQVPENEPAMQLQQEPEEKEEDEK